MTVRTRFAPSPTGYLHIGGVRTALFCWLFARRHGGQFILRIDDTDESRHVEQAVELIQSGLKWLGLDWDEGPEVGGSYGPYFQSQRRELYDQALITLIENGHAYPCEATAEELDTQRTAAKAAKRPFVYRGPHRNLSPEECLAIFKEKKTALRFKVPEGQTTVLNDHVRGQVEWQTDLLGDFTIARSGGGPLYNLASIYDDVAMKITHIVRAEEHLSNTHPQLLLARALGDTVPEFAHVPYVAEPGGKKKLSKRNPPPGVMVGLDEYESVGYLPEAVCNALARLGWSLDDKTEIMSRETVIENFSLDRITKAPAGLDPDKIFWIQDHYMRQLPAQERVDRMIPFLQGANIVSDPITPEDKERVEMLDAASGDRLKLLSDIIRYGSFAFAESLDYDKKSLKNLKKEGVEQQLESLIGALESLEDFNLEAVEAAVRKVAEDLGVGGKINHALRASTTGRSVGPGVYDCVIILGKEKALRNMKATLEGLRSDDLTASPQP